MAIRPKNLVVRLLSFFLSLLNGLFFLISHQLDYTSHIHTRLARTTMPRLCMTASASETSPGPAAPLPILSARQRVRAVVYVFRRLCRRAPQRPSQPPRPLPLHEMACRARVAGRIARVFPDAGEAAAPTARYVEPPRRAFRRPNRRRSASARPLARPLPQRRAGHAHAVHGAELLAVRALRAAQFEARLATLGVCEVELVALLLWRLLTALGFDEFTAGPAGPPKSVDREVHPDALPKGLRQARRRRKRGKAGRRGGRGGRRGRRPG